MSTTCISLITRKQGLSLAEFKAHYEDCHAPMVQALLPGIVEYSRYYVDVERPIALEGGAPKFDAVAKIVFSDLDVAMTVAAAPAIATRIAEDEANFLDSTKTVFFLVKEYPGLSGDAASLANW